MANKRPKLLILDGNALIHRSFHALPLTLTTKDGQLVNAVYGFASFLLKAVKEFKPEYMALTLDKQGPTFRHVKFADYKATRVKAPDELYAQIPLVKEVAKAFNIPIYEQSGYEADDLIGTISQKVNGTIDKIIVTGDMDTLQLVNDHTFVFTMSRGIAESVLYDETEVKKKYGFGPEALVDYKALRGDPSDNIPGVAGIGEKTATDLIQDFGSLDNVYKNIDSPKIKDRIRQLLIDYKQQAYLSRELATIDQNVDIDFKLSDVKFGDYQQENIIQLFSELEFKSLLNRLKEIDDKFVLDEHKVGRDNKFNRNAQDFDYQLIDSEVKFNKFLAVLKKQKEFTFDTETSDLDNFSAKLLGISFSWEEGQAYYLVINSGGQNKPAQSDLFNYNQPEAMATASHPWLKKLATIFQDESIKKFGHNLKFDVKVLASCGLVVNGLAFDTMVASYLLNPGNRQHNLDSLAFIELGFVKISKDELLGKGRQKTSFAQVPVNKLMLYSCEDADFTQRLVNKLSMQLNKENLDKLFANMEMPLVGVLARMETNGIKIDAKYFAELDKKIDQRIKVLQKKIWVMAGGQFNIASVQQLREVLFHKLQIATAGLVKTKTGISTGADELAKLQGAHPIIDLILEYRELAKLSSTYVKALPLLINKVTGRVHTSYNQTVTATGRLSSTNPNLQNIPVRSDLAQEIRRGFVASRGCQLVALDYSQIELRLVAHMSGDPKMIKAFKNNEDIHRATAAEINKVKLLEVTKDMRRKAKAVNFGILYGQGPHGLAAGTGLSFVEAKDFIDNYFAIYKKVKEYIDRTIVQARGNGYVETLFHRRRYLGDINSSMAMVRKSAERMAVNTPLQGTAADMIKVAMIKIDKLLQTKYADQVKMVLQVHDELVFEIDNGVINKVVPTLRQIMANVIKLDVPILVDAKAGKNWLQMKEIK
ncbi:MAG: DNA polymerase I [bacterium]